MLKTQRIPLEKLAQNIGQIPGLPMNPRQWTKEDVERLAKSLAETPELFEARPIIAIPFDGTNVILGGNLRYEGARHNGDKDAPVILLPADTPVEKLKEIVVKDNGSFGAWDFDALANEWDDNPLAEWGIPAWSGRAGSVDINGLFDENKEVPGNPKPTIIEVEVPVGMEDKIEGIRAALQVALEPFEGVKMR